MSKVRKAGASYQANVADANHADFSHAIWSSHGQASVQPKRNATHYTTKENLCQMIGLNTPRAIHAEISSHLYVVP